MGRWEVGDGLKRRFNVQREADCCWKSEMPFTPRFEVRQVVDLATSRRPGAVLVSGPNTPSAG